MSQPQWGLSSRPGQGSGGDGGSVRRARERMEEDLSPEMPYPPPPAPEERARQRRMEQEQRRYEQPRAAPAQPQPSQIPIPIRVRPQLPAGLGSKNGPGPIGVAISWPTQVPQWPLAGTIEGVPDATNKKNPYKPPSGRGDAPKRPPRPSHVPSMLDASRLQDHTPSFQYQPSKNQPQGRVADLQDDENSDADETRSPITPSSRPSTTSSVGTIPDFPVPIPPPPSARRSINLGPPPTSRRGASSYYSQASFVSPIPEESLRSHPSHGSYASSAAIPPYWGADAESPRSDYDGEMGGNSPRDIAHGIIEERGESRESNFDDSDERGLIRSASLGKKAKPTIITTKSSDRADPRPAPMPQQPSKLERMGILAGIGAAGAVGGLTAARVKGGQRESMWPMAGNQKSPLAGGTGLLDKSTSSSETSIPQLAYAVTTGERSPMPPPGTYNAKGASELLGAYNAASSLEPGSQRISQTQSPGFNRLSAIRRPPRLDIDAVREAEARGSLTSLPDLIRRATRLAAMMDRGRRPASRNALDDFPSESDLDKESKEAKLSSGDEARQSGISGMLAAFPPPGLATPSPTPDATRPISTWPTAKYDDTGGLEKPPAPRKRRCCGLPVWGFLLVLFILLIVFAAAVVIPLELFLFHKPKVAASTPNPPQSCATNATTMCQNGGSTFVTSNACSCICINGFTGPTCTVGGTTGCTTATLTAQYSNVTLGDSIPRLIAAAQSNFSIPLFPSNILEGFSAANLSCISENALVTFDGLSNRVGAANQHVIPATPSSAAPSETFNGGRRDATAVNVIASDPSSPILARAFPSSIAVRAAGISLSPTTTSTTTTLTTTTLTPSSYPSSGAQPGNNTFIVTETVLDFARVATLFILQQNQLDAAVQAQTLLQKFFTDADVTPTEEGRNVTVGTGMFANLIDFSIDLGNGSVGALNQSLSRRTLL